MAKETSRLARLARKTIDMFVRTGERLSPPDELVKEIGGEKAGVFVSIKKYGDLRGCIGTFEPNCPNIIEEVIQNAISSATQDPRFPAVTQGELDHLDITVDVLTTPEPVSGPDDLDPKRYGAIVKTRWRKGLLLPDIEGVDSVEQQLEICRQKAGIGAREKAELLRFEVKRNR